MSGKIKYLSKLLLVLLPFYTLSPVEFSMKQIIAYPNPFNPETDMLTLKPSDATVFSGNAEYTVYNFNERPVYSGSVSNSQIYWSGHRNNGTRVPPGLYIVRVIQTLPDYSTGVGYVKVLIK